MSEGKEKKVEVRDVVRAELAQMIMREKGMEAMYRTKEGLVLTVGEQDLVIRVVQKKERIKTGDVIEVIEAVGSETVEAGGADEEAGEETGEEAGEEASEESEESV